MYIYRSSVKGTPGERKREPQRRKVCVREGESERERNSEREVDGERQKAIESVTLARI